MSAGTAYKHAQISGGFDAIVVGSGIGGLGVAALLAKLAHKRVLVLERHYAVGGFTHTFTRPGFEWDVGVHYVGGVHDRASATSRWFEFLTEGRLDWAPMGEVYDRFLIGGETYAFPAGRARGRSGGDGCRGAADPDGRRPRTGRVPSSAMRVRSIPMDG
jgi:all-trans-retinol 13,14-reductase